jgi:hypothetical protein
MYTKKAPFHKTKSNFMTYGPEFVNGSCTSKNLPPTSKLVHIYVTLPVATLLCIHITKNMGTKLVTQIQQ